MALLHVVDELHDDDRLADAGAAEESDLSAFHERRDQVDDLDAGFENFRLRLEVHEVGTLAVDRPALCASAGIGGAVVDRLAEHVEDASERRGADRHRDRGARVDRIHAAHDAVGGAHRDGAHLVAADVLLHFDDDADVGARVGRSADLEGVVDLGEVLGLEFHVEDGADDLDDLTNVRGSGGCHKTSNP